MDLRMGAEGSLGWADGPLDGLNCYLRCVESVLRARGYSPRDVAHCLAAPVELLPRGRTWSPDPPLASARLEWAGPEGSLATIRAAFGRGDPVLLYPDGNDWPDDEYADRRRAYHHAVLLVAVADDHVTVLDTDADPAAAHRRTYRLTPRARRALHRYAVLRAGPPPPAPDAAALLRRSAATLAADLPDVSAFVDGCVLDEPTARGLDLVVLGDWQPQLFVLALVLEEAGTAPEVRDALRAAALATRDLGRLILGMHRLGDPSVYPHAGRALRVVRDRLADTEAALREAVGAQPPVPPGTPLARTLREAVDWVFPGSVW